nr:uncharacterized protein LOC129448702 [Misgurnus anguillicaudatus]XP_055067246.1 uncharacterized protein LOC129448702 [Misgurnus anguillicaudatus]XP_055067247.1 uncharacterized protein LOC129448702 [Misgurnus anguillicaudatus]XP_055067248.1 uncharacterized protein LOC129448702 [Misgurnus anguillicaudatus]
MSLTMSKGEGVTVITVSTNPKSKWPILCQILGTVCYSPVCSVAHNMKGKLTETLTALGIVQMIVGIINIAMGIFLTSVYWYYSFIRDSQAPFWLGGMFLAVGIVCILAAKFPSPCVLVIAVILNIVSAALAITAVVLHSVDLARNFHQFCDIDNYSRYGEPVTVSPEQRKNQELCLYYRQLSQVIFRGVNIMMIVLAVLQLCVTISFCVMTLKALCKKSEDAQSVEDPQLYKPLMEDATAILHARETP